MKVVTKNEAPKRTFNHIDYDALARSYNRAEIEGGVELPRVYNITLFKRAIANWGLVEGEDFSAESHKDVTLVIRISSKQMTKE